MSSGSRVIVAKYGGRVAAVAGIEVESASVPRRITSVRRTDRSLPPARSAPLMRVVVARGALAVDRPAEPCAEADALVLDRLVERLLDRGRRVGVDALLPEEQLGAEGGVLLLRGLSPLERRGEFASQRRAAVPDDLAALASEPQLRLRALGLGVRVPRAQLGLLKTVLEREDLGFELRHAPVVRT